MPNNPLTNVLTPRIRAYLYAILFVVALGFAAWEASDGDYLKAIGLLVTSLLGATAASNASWTPVEVEDEDIFDEVDAEPPTEEEVRDLPTERFHGGNDDNRFA